VVYALSYKLLVFVEPMRERHRGAERSTVVERFSNHELKLGVGDKLVDERLGGGWGHLVIPCRFIVAIGNNRKCSVSIVHCKYCVTVGALESMGVAAIGLDTDYM
jgi:hypothetical protein